MKAEELEDAPGGGVKSPAPGGTSTAAPGLQTASRILLVALAVLAGVLFLVGNSMDLGPRAGAGEDEKRFASCPVDDKEVSGEAKATQERYCERQLLRDNRLAGGTAVVGLFLMLGFMYLNGKDKGWVFGPAIGDDGRLSTSLTQTYLWTFIVVGIVGWAAALSLIYPHVSFEEVLSDNWSDYLVLLGGPFAALVVSGTTTRSRLREGLVQKVPSSPLTPVTETPAPGGGQLAEEVGGAAPPTTNATASDPVTDDDGKLDLPDTQYLFFNLIAMAYVLYRLFTARQVPDIPPMLLALCGGAAALYAANKALAANPTTITAVSPRTVQAGTTVTIRGANFAPKGTAGVNGKVPADRRLYPYVVLSGVTDAIAPEPGWRDGILQFKVPDDTASGSQQVSVVSTGGLESEPQPLDVLGASPRVDQVTGAVRPGSTLTIQALGLDAPVRVSVNGRPETVGVEQQRGGDVIHVVLPATLSGDTVALKLFGRLGDTSTDLTLDIEKPVVTSIVRSGSTLQGFGAGWWGDFGQRASRVWVNGVVAESPDFRRFPDPSGTLCAFVCDPPDGVTLAAELSVIVSDEYGRTSPALVVPASTWVE